jgi:hypothetical protein
MQKIKSVSIEKAADLYLAVLAKESTPPPFLTAVLKDHCVFYDNAFLKDTLNMLDTKGFITIYKSGTSTRYFAPAYGRPETEPSHPVKPKLLINQYRITKEGWHFVNSGQELDTKGRSERAEERKKWRERVITALIAIVVSLVTLSIKWLLFDGK